jgi:hypothetical protein
VSFLYVVVQHPSGIATAAAAATDYFRVDAYQGGCGRRQTQPRRGARRGADRRTGMWLGLVHYGLSTYHLQATIGQKSQTAVFTATSLFAPIFDDKNYNAESTAIYSVLSFFCCLLDETCFRVRLVNSLTLSVLFHLLVSACPPSPSQTLHDNTQAAIDTLKGSIALKANTVCYVDEWVDGILA